MGNMYFYEVPYTCECEVCGKKISGVIKRGPLQIGSGALPSDMQVGVNNSEMKLSKRLIERDLENNTAKSFTASNDICPHCKERQSWVPIMEPKKPSYISLYVAGIIFFPLIFLAIWAIFFFDKIIPFIILMIIGLFLGIYLPYRSQKKNKSKEMDTYNKLIKEYNDFMKSMEKRKKHNKPKIDWDLAKHTPIK